LAFAASIDDLKLHGDELYKQGDYSGAAEKYRQIVQQAPTNAQALRCLGLSLVMSHQLDEGLEACRKAAALMPADAETRYAYGFALGNAGRFRESIDEFDGALAANPNHIAAKQALSYSLIATGKECLDSDPDMAERMFDRARKVDAKNPEANGLLLKYLVDTLQKGKAMKLYAALSDDLRKHAAIQPTIKRMEADSEFQMHMRHAAAAQRGTPAQARSNNQPAVAAQNQAAQQVPCPACKLPIMSFATVCPHCSHQLRAYGSFANHDRGPAYVWQEIALTVIASLWILMSLFQAAVILQHREELMGLAGFLLALALGRIGIGIGLILRIDWIGFIAKILCYLTILGSGLGFMAGLMLGDWAGVTVNGFVLSLAGFLIYLINYNMDA
jgi:tetratricopeptide (TPR) repeat protein